jgi:hypothetical protein
MEDSRSNACRSCCTDRLRSEIQNKKSVSRFVSGDRRQSYEFVSKNLVSRMFFVSSMRNDFSTPCFRWRHVFQTFAFDLLNSRFAASTSFSSSCIHPWSAVRATLRRTAFCSKVRRNVYSPGRQQEPYCNLENRLQPVRTCYCPNNSLRLSL